MTAPTPSAPGLGAMMRLPGLPAFMAGRFASAVGNWTERIALGWLVWTLTESAGWVGLAAFLRLGPALILGPFIGVWADRIGPNRLLRYALWGNAALAAMVAVSVSVLSIGVLCAAIFGLGMCQALGASPIKAVIPQIVPRAHLPAAISLSSVGFQLAAFVGPALAGAMIALGGVWLAVLLAALGNGFFATALLRWRAADVRAPASDGGMWGDLRIGLAYCLTDPVTGPVLALHIVASLLLRPLIDLLPALAGSLGDGGAGTLGLLTAAAGGGAFCAALFLTLRPGAATLKRRMIAGSLLAAGSLGAVGFVHQPPAVAALLFVFGLGLVLRGTSAQILIQLAVPDHLRGRVAGFYSTIIRGLSAVGAVLIGLSADAFGFAPVLASVFGLCLLALLLLRPRLTALTLPHPERPSEAT